MTRRPVCHYVRHYGPCGRPATTQLALPDGSTRPVCEPCSEEAAAILRWKATPDRKKAPDSDLDDALLRGLTRWTRSADLHQALAASNVTATRSRMTSRLRDLIERGLVTTRGQTAGTSYRRTAAGTGWLEGADEEAA